jgi:hypothetical protein
MYIDVTILAMYDKSQFRTMYDEPLQQVFEIFSTLYRPTTLAL